MQVSELGIKKEYLLQTSLVINIKNEEEADIVFFVQVNE